MDRHQARPRSDESSEHSSVDFWERQLRGAPETLELPTDRPRSAVNVHAPDRFSFGLCPQVTRSVRALAQETGSTLFSTLLSGFAVLLSRWSGQNEFVICARLMDSEGLDTRRGIDGFIPVRVCVGDAATTEALLVRVAADELAARADLTFSELRAQLGSVGISVRPQVLFELGPESSCAEAELSLSFQAEDASLIGVIKYARGLFDRITIEWMATCLTELLGAMATRPGECVHQLPMLTAVQRDHLLKTLNQTPHVELQEKLIHELFEEQAARTPDALAVRHDGSDLTFSALNARANQLGHFLRERGVGSGHLVGLCVERGLDMVVGILGTLKAGAAYVPLDPAYPSERLAYMLSDASPRVLLAQARLQANLPAFGGELILIDRDWSAIATRPATNLPASSIGVRLSDLAFVIYTSGSTGTPKGAMNEHRGMVNRILSQRHFEAFAPGDICCQKTSLSFVDAVFETLGPLCHGYPLVIIPASIVRDVRQMAAVIRAERVTRLVTVPSVARSMLEDERAMRDLAGLRSWTLSGEEVRPDLLKRLQRSLRNCEFIDQYGSSEVSSDAAIYKSKRLDTERVPIGRPLPNVQIYVLDRYGEPVPLGVPGEIHVGGVGVGRGYLNRPDLTAARFLPDPFNPGSEKRLYKTGDLGRWRADGMLEYLGRADHQVKIRGFRIELGEIEAQLRRHVDVRDAVVIAREDQSGEKRLVAYLTAQISAPPGSPGPDALRAHLHAALPEHMVPAAFVLLDALPRTPNGKLDRRALPAPSLRAYGTSQYEAPRTPTERLVAGIWQDLLSIERVGRQDNFFRLGGHSLLIVHMLERLQREGLYAEAHAIYANPTLADVASSLATERADTFKAPPSRIPADCDFITPQMLPLVTLDAQQIEEIVARVPGGARNVKDIYPLAPLQEGMLFHHLLGQRGDTYVETTLLSVSSRDRLEELIAALQSVIDRHDILRTAMLWEGLPRPVQVVYRHATLNVEEVQLSGGDPGERINEWLRPERHRLDLRKAPLLQLQIATSERPGAWYALLQVHHMVDDEASVRVMIGEVLTYLAGQEQSLPEPVPYRAHVAQALHYASTHDPEAFFRRKFGDVCEPTAPFGLLDVRGDGTRLEEHRQLVEPLLARRVRVLARSLGVTAATFFHAAWSLVVARTSGREDVVFGAVLLGRFHSDVGAKRVIGMFINTLPLRLRVSNCTARDVVDQTYGELADLLVHEQASLAVAQRCSGISGSTPLFSTVLNFRHASVEPQADWAAAGIEEVRAQYRTNYPITVSIDDRVDGYSLITQTDSRIRPERISQYLCTALDALVTALEYAPNTSCSALSILSAEEREKVLRVFNATEAPVASERLVHEFFEQQVRKTPEALAVICGTHSLPFSALNERANQLARHLRQQGVSSDALVGICMERSVDMIVAILGTLKAGGAYVPLDPEYPRERLAYVLRDSQPKVVLTHSKLRSLLPASLREVIAIDEDWPQIAEHGVTNLDSSALGMSSTQLAYVIYTSGSTGQPKGVMIEHHGLISLWQGLETVYRRSGPCKRVAVNASFNFDASVKQIIQLLSGRTLVLIPQPIRLDAPAILRLMMEQQVEAIDCTPSQLKIWISAGLLEANDLRLRVVLVGGEPIDPALWSTLAVCETTDFYNVYGPTECTVDATVACLRGDTSGPHIGPPMQNKRVYILDDHQQPVPIGVPGEIHIAGAGIARGYLGRPKLSAARFVPEVFSADPQARMYRSGDLGKWRADGAIEYVGRNDHQVKIRGFRMELGEIEAQLLQHPQVRQVVVTANPDEHGDNRLVAYIVEESSRGGNAPDQDHIGNVRDEMVSQWNRVHDETYSASCVGPSFIGWNSSYTGQPIAEEQMREWQANTVERIRGLKPRRVLEIGCGVGLLLQHLAPECEAYVGTDFSSAALAQLGGWMQEHPSLQHVQLLHRGATELGDLPAGSFDTVVLNSVVQYFPDIHYLLEVLRGAARLVRAGGHIFVGDVRHLGLLWTFHSAVQLSKASATVSAGQLRKRVARVVSQEKELVIDPQFFEVLPSRVEGIAAADVQFKRGRAANELTRYRYDVVLSIGPVQSYQEQYEQVRWGEEVRSLAQLEAGLQAHRWAGLRICGIANERLSREVAARELIETSDEAAEASALRRQISERAFEGVDPQSLWDLAEANGYELAVRADAQVAECFEAQLVDRSRIGTLPKLARVPLPGKVWREYANDPLESSFRQQLIPQLREYLKERLPEYMVPSAWMALKQLPLTPSGKVDRQALPTPHSRPEEMGEYLPPRTDLERALAEIWAQMLRVDQVGVQDNFFELGGHSLLATRVIARIRELLQIDLPVRRLFDAPTIERLALQIETDRRREAAAEERRLGTVRHDLRERIREMPEEDVLAQIAELERELAADSDVSKQSSATH
jgi:amino acid adenylation domain-containing protein